MVTSTPGSKIASPRTSDNFYVRFCIKRQGKCLPDGLDAPLQVGRRAHQLTHPRSARGRCREAEYRARKQINTKQSEHAVMSHLIEFLSR